MANIGRGHIAPKQYPCSACVLGSPTHSHPTCVSRSDLIFIGSDSPLPRQVCVLDFCCPPLKPSEISSASPPGILFSDSLPAPCQALVHDALVLRGAFKSLFLHPNPSLLGNLFLAAHPIYPPPPVSDVHFLSSTLSLISYLHSRDHFPCISNFCSLK